MSCYRVSTCEFDDHYLNSDFVSITNSPASLNLDSSVSVAGSGLASVMDAWRALE